MLPLTIRSGNLLREVLETIRRRFHDPAFDVNRLCREVRHSRSHLHRRLRQAGAPPAIDLIHQARLRHACDLLRTTDLTVAEIAYTSGFNDANYFSRLFRAKMGCSPKGFRGSGGAICARK